LAPAKLRVSVRRGTIAFAAPAKSWPYWFFNKASHDEIGCRGFEPFRVLHRLREFRVQLAPSRWHGIHPVGKGR
jgi:hypothetical protein